MKKLSETMMRLYEIGISEEEYIRRYNEYYSLYKSKMEKYGASSISKISISFKRRLHKLVILFLKANALFKEMSNEVISDKHSITSRPVIYAVTHIGKYDIETLGAILKEHFSVLTSDFERTSESIDGFFLSLIC